jgi:hypothetical protein
MTDDEIRALMEAAEIEAFERAHEDAFLVNEICEPDPDKSFDFVETVELPDPEAEAERTMLAMERERAAHTLLAEARMAATDEDVDTLRVLWALLPDCIPDLQVGFTADGSFAYQWDCSEPKPWEAEIMAAMPRLWTRGPEWAA